MLALSGAWGDNRVALGIFTDVGAYPPKPPPLVELQRNPSGLRFFFLKNGAFIIFSRVVESTRLSAGFVVSFCGAEARVGGDVSCIPSSFAKSGASVAALALERGRFSYTWRSCRQRGRRQHRHALMFVGVSTIVSRCNPSYVLMGYCLQTVVRPDEPVGR